VFKGSATNLNVGVNALGGGGGDSQYSKNTQIKKYLGCMTPRPAPMVAPPLVVCRAMLRESNLKNESYFLCSYCEYRYS